MGQTLSVYRPSTTEETILQAEVYGANTISLQTLNYCRHCKQNQLAVSACKTEVCREHTLLVYPHSLEAVQAEVCRVA